MQARSEVQFKVGDKAVYPAQGVAEVVSIEEKDIAGSRQKFYVLRILDTDRKIMVPVNNARSVGLRPPISESEVREIFEILRERTVAFDNQTWNRRFRGFMDKIKTGSVFDVAEVMRDLYRLKAEKSLSFGERRMLETARALIVKEIAVTREKSEKKVQGEIEQIFETNWAARPARSRALAPRQPCDRTEPPACSMDTLRVLVRSKARDMRGSRSRRNTFCARESRHPRVACGRAPSICVRSALPERPAAPRLDRARSLAASRP